VPVRNEGSGPKKKASPVRPAPVRPDDRAVRPVPPPAPRPVVGEGPKKPAVWARDRKVDEFARQVAAGRIQGRRGLEAVQRLGLSDAEKRQLQELTRQYSQETQRDVGRHLARGTANAVASALTLPTTWQTAEGTIETVRENVEGLQRPRSGGRQRVPADRAALVTQDVRSGVFPGFGRLFGGKAAAASKAPVVAKAAAKTPEEKLLGSVRGSGKLRRQQESLRSTERARRAEAMDKALLSTPGDAGWRAMLGEMAGELPKIQFGALKQHNISNADLAKWYEHIKTRPDFRPYDKLNVKRALDNLVAERVPTKSDKRLLTRLWGEEKTAEVAQQATNWKRITESGVNLINVPRAMKSSFDLSAPFRQGLVLGASHPVVFSKNFPVMIKAAKSERYYDDQIEKIITSDTFDLAQRDGLAMTDLENIATREEAFIGANYAERFNPGIPGKPKAQIPIGRGVRASGRAYTLFLNKFRKDVYDMLIEQAGHNDPVAGKAIADIINIATGRGRLGHFEEAIKIANAAFFSPRLIASRVELLMNPTLYVGRNASKKIARREARRGMRNLLLAGGALLYLADQIPGVDVGTDPRSSDFGRVRFGDTRIDIWGGLQPYVVAAYRIKSGEKVSSTTGEVSKVAGGAFKQYDNFLGRFVAVIGDLLQQKAAPVPAYFNSWRKEENFEGGPFDPWVEAAKLNVPIGFESTYDTAQEHGPGPAAVGFGLNAFGFGVNTYGVPEKQRATQRPPEKPADAPDEWMAKVARYLNRPIDQIPAPLRKAREAQLSVQERQANLKDELGLTKAPNDRQMAAIKIDVLVETQPAFRQVEKVLRQQIRTPAAAKVLNKWLDEKLGYGLVEEWSRKAGEADAIRKLSRVKVAK
jgi:hypothetical protein